MISKKRYEELLKKENMNENEIDQVNEYQYYLACEELIPEVEKAVHAFLEVHPEVDIVNVTDAIDGYVKSHFIFDIVRKADGSATVMIDEYMRDDFEQVELNISKEEADALENGSAEIEFDPEGGYRLVMKH